MTTIKIHDGVDDWGWPYYIGYYPLDAATIIKQIEAAAGDDLKIRISSGGGFVSAGWEIYNAIMLYKEEHSARVTVVIDGIAASIASVIAMAGDIVIMMRGSLLMVHKPTNGICGMLDADELKKEAEMLDKIQDVIVDIYAFKSGLDEDLIHEMMNEETWLKPSEALSLGFCDEIASGSAIKVITNSLQPYMNNMPRDMRTYCNRLLINNNSKMATKKTSKTLIKENKSIVNRVVRAFKDIFKFENAEAETADGGTIYFDGELNVGTAVYDDPEMTEVTADGEIELADGRIITVTDGEVSAVEEDEEDDAANGGNDDQVQNKGRLRQLQNKVKDLETENTELREQLEEANSILNKIKNVKSAGKPANRQQNFSKGKETNQADNFREEMRKRRESYKNKK
ncbi:MULTISPECIES: head maturation protease, ClpP-related [Olivibacter]|uniref:ATP-dependent Clp protease proteolytic subunit n=1 Tax=Olivibacter jilunii TaxID=985016 RepID=A0ABW6B019_9SPHI